MHFLFCLSYPLVLFDKVSTGFCCEQSSQVLQLWPFDLFKYLHSVVSSPCVRRNFSNTRLFPFLYPSPIQNRRETRAGLAISTPLQSVTRHSSVFPHQIVPPPSFFQEDLP